MSLQGFIQEELAPHDHLVEDTFLIGLQAASTHFSILPSAQKSDPFLESHRDDALGDLIIAVTGDIKCGYVGYAEHHLGYCTNKVGHKIPIYTASTQSEDETILLIALPRQSNNVGNRILTYYIVRTDYEGHNILYRYEHDRKPDVQEQANREDEEKGNRRILPDLPQLLTTEQYIQFASTYQIARTLPER